MLAIHRFRRIHVIALVVAAAAWADAASAITLRIDYGTDTGSFFGAGNPDGAAAGTDAKEALDAAALFYSSILDDTFSAITPPTKFYGSLGGEATWYWKRKFPHPETGRTDAQLNESFDANEYVVFVGARPLPDSDLGRGGAGGWSVRGSSRNGDFTADEKNLLDQMDDDFIDAVSKRGETSGFGIWGGSIAFNTAKAWHFDHTTNPTGNRFDFFSVALHELGHALGLGSSSQWTNLVSGTSFTGTNANAVYALTSQVPLASPTDKAHWLAGIADSTVYEGGASQKPIMIPDLPVNTRRQLTNLDAAALTDLGWQIDLPIAATATATASLASAAEFGGSAGVAALTASVVPEPTGIVLMFLGVLALRCASRLNR